VGHPPSRKLHRRADRRLQLLRGAQRRARTTATGRVVRAAPAEAEHRAALVSRRERRSGTRAAPPRPRASMRWCSRFAP
jgi:hypothetical protein